MQLHPVAATAFIKKAITRIELSLLPSLKNLLNSFEAQAMQLWLEHQWHEQAIIIG